MIVLSPIFTSLEGFYLDMQKYQLRYESSSSELERNKVSDAPFLFYSNF